MPLLLIMLRVSLRSMLERPVLCASICEEGKQASTEVLYMSYSGCHCTHSGVTQSVVHGVAEEALPKQDPSMQWFIKGQQDSSVIC